MPKISVEFASWNIGWKAQANLIKKNAIYIYLSKSEEESS